LERPVRCGGGEGRGKMEIIEAKTKKTFATE
jgi:hypothetical protein